MAAFDNLSNPSEYLAYWGKTYRNELLSNILPFWMKYGLDKENGGYFTCVDRDGTLMDSTKSVWFQDDSPLSWHMPIITLKERRMAESL